MSTPRENTNDLRQEANTNDLRHFLKVVRPDWSCRRKNGHLDIAKVIKKLQDIGVYDTWELVRRVNENNINEDLSSVGHNCFSKATVESIRKQSSILRAIEHLKEPYVRQVGLFAPVPQLLTGTNLRHKAEKLGRSGGPDSPGSRPATTEATPTGRRRASQEGFEHSPSVPRPSSVGSISFSDFSGMDVLGLAGSTRPDSPKSESQSSRGSGVFLRKMAADKCGRPSSKQLDTIPSRHGSKLPPSPMGAVQDFPGAFAMMQDMSGGSSPTERPMSPGESSVQGRPMSPLSPSDSIGSPWSPADSQLWSPADSARDQNSDGHSRSPSPQGVPANRLLLRNSSWTNGRPVRSPAPGASLSTTANLLGKPMARHVTTSSAPGLHLMPSSGAWVPGFQGAGLGANLPGIRRHGSAAGTVSWNHDENDDDLEIAGFKGPWVAKWGGTKSNASNGGAMLREQTALDERRQLSRFMKPGSCMRKHACSKIRSRLEEEKERDAQGVIDANQRCVNIRKNLGFLQQSRRDLGEQRRKLQDAIDGPRSPSPKPYSNLSALLHSDSQMYQRTRAQTDCLEPNPGDIDEERTTLRMSVMSVSEKKGRSVRAYTC